MTARSWIRRLAVIGFVAGVAVMVAAPVATAASDIWGNVGPGSQLEAGGLSGRYPLSHYRLDQHFEAVSASLSGVDVSGVPPMIAYFLASILWALTAFLANLLISLFGFAFSLDLVNGSQATAGDGALAPVASAIHSIYAHVFGGPWLVLAITVVGIWAMWKALVQRRYSETAGALGLSLIYVVVALFFVAQPGATIGSASKWTNDLSSSFLSISHRGTVSDGERAKNEVAEQLHRLLIFKPWVVLNFGGLEHCVVSGTGSDDADPESAPVRPLSTSPSRDAALAARLAGGAEVTADGKVCVNNATKYAAHFLRFGWDTDERDDQYDALDKGDASKVPNEDPARAGYRLGVADKPATDAMEKGGQDQRLLVAIVVFVGELGAFLLLGSLAIGIILAQVLLLLLLAFAPVALVAAAIPGRGHDFFKGWLEKLAGYLLRKAAYSLILAVILAVNGALASATSALGWLMSFGLQGLFFWTVFIQRKTLADSLIGIATGPGAPGRDGTLRLLALYAGARTVGRPMRKLGRAARTAGSAPVRAAGVVAGRLGGGGAATGPGTASPAPWFGTSHSAPVGGDNPSMSAPADPGQRDSKKETGGREDRPDSTGKPASSPSTTTDRERPAHDPDDQEQRGTAEKRDRRRSARSPSSPTESPQSPPESPQDQRPPTSSRTGGSAEPAAESVAAEGDLGADLRADRERGRPTSDGPDPDPRPDDRQGTPLPRRRRPWRRRKGKN